MSRAADTASSVASSPVMLKRQTKRDRRSSGDGWGFRNGARYPASLAFWIGGLPLLLIALVPMRMMAQADCLACHADKGLQDASGKNISVDGDTFGQSIHGSLGCNACHADIKGYPHPDKVAMVKCDTCHAGQASELAGSVHSNSAEHPCTSCHGSAHAIFTKDDKRSTVYALNVPKTCGACHGRNGMAQKHGLPTVFPSYID